MKPHCVFHFENRQVFLPLPVLTKNGKTLKQQLRKLNSSLQKRMKVQKDLKISGMMMNANLQ